MGTIQQSKIQEINTLHGELETLARTGLSKAIRIGEILTECKDRLRHGQFSPFVLDNCAFSIRTAQNYMKLYSNRERIAGTDSVATAYRLLKYETVSYLESGGPLPDFEDIQASIEKYIAAQVQDDTNSMAASHHAERVAFWVEHTAAELDASNIADLTRFEKQLKWLEDKFAEGHLRAQRRLGELLREIQA